MPAFSDKFQQLYCDPAIFDVVSIRHPISLKNVLPFQYQDLVIDDSHLLDAELAYLTNKNDNTRRAVINAYVRCGLLPESEAATVLPAIDFFDADFFDLMGLVYTNAGMYLCALRWYREHIVELEAQTPNIHSNTESVYASVGFCLYALGLFEEAIAWTKSCAGPQFETDIACRTLIEDEAKQVGGTLLATERVDRRARYTIAVPDPPTTSLIGPRLKTALEALAPLHEFYISCVSNTAPHPPIPEGYPFRVELDNSNYLRHKMNFLFALCGQADALTANGHAVQARQLLSEAAILEPNADFIQERIQALP